MKSVENAWGVIADPPIKEGPPCGRPSAKGITSPIAVLAGSGSTSET